MRKANESGLMCLLLSTFVLAGGATSAHAALTISAPPGVGWTKVNGSEPSFEFITINVVTGFNDGTFTITGDGSDTDLIEDIIVNQAGNANSTLRLKISNIETLCAVTQGNTGTERFVIENLQTTLLGTQTFNLPYTIQAHDIKNVVVSFNMYIAMYILDDGDIFESNSRISNVNVLGPGSEAHFTNLHGPIELIDVSSMQKSEIHCLKLKNFTSTGDVQTTTFSSASPSEPMTIDQFDILGDFLNGIITKSKIDVESIAGVQINGDLDARIKSADALPGDFNTRPLVIGGTFEGMNSIELPASGLKSQIIINNNDVGGTWEGDVEVDTTTLAPGYTNSASSLGGGSVGCVPFALHGNDSDPVISTCVARASAPDDLNPIKMRDYGPVMWDAPSNGDPFTIERRAIGSGNAWIDQSACFSQAVDTTTNTIVNLTPDDTTGQSTTTLEAGFEYRVTLNQFDNEGQMENVLRCDVTDTPEVADHATEYVFSVGELSLGDADNSGVVNFDDVNSVLMNWLTTDCLAEGDADRDGDVDSDDTTSVLGNWLNTYTGCTAPCLEGASSEGGYTPPSPCDRTMADALTAMGFDNPGQFAQWFGDLAADEQELAVIGIDEWLDCLR